MEQKSKTILNNNFFQCVDPKSYKEVVTSENVENWEETMDEKML